MLLHQLLDNLTIDSPQVFQDVEIIPLLSACEPAPFLELDDALETGVAEIVEISDSGSVPELTVINRSQRDIVIFDGEQLIGAKQNRIVNITVVVPANSTLPIPVSCVEQGRWRYTSRKFAAGEAFAYPSLRVSTHEDVTYNMRSRGNRDSDQSRIWRDISAKAARMSVDSETMAMSDLYEGQSLNQEVLDSVFKVKDDQIGYLAFVKGGFAGGDLFGSAKVCRKKMPKLIRGFFLESRDPSVSFGKVEIGEILKEVRDAEHLEVDTVGKGRERRFEALHVQGAWKEVDGFIPHVVIFPKVKR